MGDEVSDAALIMELDLFATGTLVGQDDPQAAREQSRLAKTLLQRFGRELELFEDLSVGQERDRRAGVALLRLADHCEVRVGHATGELLAIELLVATHFRDQPFGEGVHDGHTDAVQAARNLVRRTVRAELSTGVQLGQDNSERGGSLLLHLVDGDPRAVVLDRHRVVRMEGDFDSLVTSGERLVELLSTTS